MTNQISWFSEEAGFFGPEYLMEYKEKLTHKRTMTEVDFVERTLNLNSKINILDVPCGHGRHSIELAKRGYGVTGFDLNLFFLSKAQEEADTASVSVRFKQGDMRKLNFDSEFDVVLNLFTAMGYFDSDEDDVRFMAGVHRALKPKGKFLIDYINRNWVIRNFKSNDWCKLLDGTLLLTKRCYDDVNGRNIERLTKIKNGVVIDTFTTSVRLYTTSELISMAERVGFTFKEAFGDFIGNPLKIDSRRTVLHFEKQ